MEWLYRLAGIFIESEQRLDQRKEEYDLPGSQTDKLCNPGWWKGVDEQHDSANGGPDLGIHLGVFLAEGHLEDRCV